MSIKFKHAQFQRSSARGTFSNWGLNRGAEKMCFQRKTDHISETVKNA